MDAPNEGNIPGELFTFSVLASFWVPAGHPKFIKNRTFIEQGGAGLSFYTQIVAHTQNAYVLASILTPKAMKKQ